MKQDKKGFTLIELLAVIVILAIIALIAVPIVMNIITKANKSAFKDSAYGIIKAGELYYAEHLLEPNGMESNETFEFPNNIGSLQIKGSLPTSGGMIITKDGKVAITISNGKYCVRKDYDDSDITIDESLEDCVTPGGPIVYTNGSMSSENKCIKSGTCENGTLVNVKVNTSENYDFYTIKDTGNELTLIMNKNLGNEVEWVSQADYEAAGGTSYDSQGNNEKGPLTALTALEQRTTGWSNVVAITYTLTDDGGTDKYPSMIRNNVRARLLTKTEASALGCTGTDNSCSSYLYTNNNDYWLSTAYSSIYRGWTVQSASVKSDRVGSEYGIRPVIKISK